MEKEKIIAIAAKTFYDDPRVNMRSTNLDGERALIFTGVECKGNLVDALYAHTDVLTKAGAQSGFSSAMMSIPGFHEQGVNPGKTNVALANDLKVSELQRTFPNADIILVKSVDELGTEYKKLITERLLKNQGLTQKRDGRNPTD